MQGSIASGSLVCDEETTVIQIMDAVIALHIFSAIQRL
jgi:hypothetical protein